MKVLSCTLASLLLITGCVWPFGQKATNSECNEPACKRTAQRIEQPRRNTRGLPFLINKELQFALSKKVEKIYQRSEVLILVFDDRTKLASWEMDIDKLGLKDSDITAVDFFEYVFLEDFTGLQLLDTKKELLDSLKLWKQLVAGLDSPSYFKFGQSTAFFYLTATENYRVVIVNDKTPKKAVFINLLGFSSSGFNQFIATLRDFGY